MEIRTKLDFLKVYEHFICKAMIHNHFIIKKKQIKKKQQAITLKHNINKIYMVSYYAVKIVFVIS